MAKAKKNKIWIYTGIGLIAILIIFAIFKGSKEEITRVTAEEAALRTISETVSANGKVQPEVEVKISPDVAGEITDLFVREGDSVKAGQLLLRINPEIWSTNLERAFASLNNAKANAAGAKARLAQAKARLIESEPSYNRNKKLFADKVISLAEFQTSEATYLSAKAEVDAAHENVKAAEFTVKSAEAAVREAQENLRRTNIYAPMNGVVSKLNVEKGERVVGTSQMAGTELLRVADLSSMEMKVEVGENDIVRVKLGDTAEIEIDAYGKRKFIGIVKEIANSPLSTTGTSGSMSADQVTNFEVKIRILRESYADLSAKLSINQSPFRPGMSGTVEIKTRKVTNVITVPIEAVTTDKSESNNKKDQENNADDEDVQVEKKSEKSDANSLEEKNKEIVYKFVDGKAIKTEVKTGIQDNRYIQIISGLSEKDIIITGPYSAVTKTLKDGDLVKKVEKSELFKTP